MHNLFIKWLYAFLFITCKVSVDAFRLLYSYLFLQNCLFVTGASFAESHWQFLAFSVCSFFVREFCLSVVKRTWLMV